MILNPGFDSERVEQRAVKGTGFYRRSQRQRRRESGIGRVAGDFESGRAGGGEGSGGAGRFGKWEREVLTEWKCKKKPPEKSSG
jgi:hypothetical protein